MQLDNKKQRYLFPKFMQCISVSPGLIVNNVMYSKCQHIAWFFMAAECKNLAGLEVKSQMKWEFIQHHHNKSCFLLNMEIGTMSLHFLFVFTVV